MILVCIVLYTADPPFDTQNIKSSLFNFIVLKTRSTCRLLTLYLFFFFLLLLVFDKNLKLKYVYHLLLICMNACSREKSKTENYNYYSIILLFQVYLYTIPAAFKYCAVEFEYSKAASQTEDKRLKEKNEISLVSLVPIILGSTSLFIFITRLRRKNYNIIR